MKKLLLALFLLAFGFSGFGQDLGTPDYLLVKRGFKIFKLGSPIDKYSQYVEFIDKYEDERLYRIKEHDFLSVGHDIKIKTIGLTTKNGLISSIMVIVDEPYKNKFLATLMAAYGRGNKPSLTSEEAYTWYTNNKEIQLRYLDKENAGVASFNWEQ